MMVLSYSGFTGKEVCPRLDPAEAFPTQVLTFLARYKPIDCDCCNVTIGFLDRQTGRIRCNPLPRNGEGGCQMLAALEGAPMSSSSSSMSTPENSKVEMLPVDVVDGCVAKNKPSTAAASASKVVAAASEPATKAASPVVTKVAAAAAPNPEMAKKAVGATPVFNGPAKVSAAAHPAVEMLTKSNVNVAADGQQRKVFAAAPPKVAPTFIEKVSTESQKKPLAEKENPFYKPTPSVSASNNFGGIPAKSNVIAAPTASQPPPAAAAPAVKPAPVKAVSSAASSDSENRASPVNRNLAQPLGGNPFKSNKPRNNWMRLKFSPNLKPGAEVKSTFKYALNKYQIQALDDEDAAYAVQDKIADYIAANPDKTYAKLNKKPAIDDIVLACYGEGEYYRARIMDIREKDCTMLYIDFGDTGKNTYDLVYEIPDELMQAPVYSLTLGLLGIPREVPPNVEPSAAITKQMDEHVILDLSGPLEISEAWQVDGVLRNPANGQTINEYFIALLGDQI